MKTSDVHEREKPAVRKMNEEANQFRAVAVRSEHGPEQIRNVHSRHAKSLTGRENRSEYDGPRKTPDQPMNPVHVVRFILCVPSSMSRKVSAALITPRWVNACGKLP